MTTVWRIGYIQPAPTNRKASSTTPTAPDLTNPGTLEVFRKELGLGSTRDSGRWHTAGRLQMVYSGSSRALCQLEKRVHANGFALKNQGVMRLTLPEDAVLMDVATDIGLPNDWSSDVMATRAIGDQWLASGISLGLWVPSAVEPSEMNLLINPQVRAFDAIGIVIERYPFKFDERLFKAN